MRNRHGATTRRPALGLAGLALVAMALAGCSSGGAGDAAAGEPTATTTVTETTTASPSPAPSTEPSREPSADPAAGGTAPLCGTPDLTAEVAPEPGGGTAGGTVVDLSLVNDGTAACRMEGWPGVSFVAGSDGEQVGAAADRVQSGRQQDVTLMPGARAVAAVKVADAGAFGADCDATRARGLRVYPPDNRQSLYVAMPTRACASDAAHLLEVAPVHPVS